MVIVLTLPYFGKWEQRVKSFSLSLHYYPPPKVALMTSSLVTTLPCLGHLRLGLPLSSSPRKVTTLDILVGLADICVGTGRSLGCTLL